MSKLLREALYNASRSETFGLQRQQQYARGLVTGVLSALMSTGISFVEAKDIVLTCLPKDFDQAAMPSFITDTDATSPPSNMFPKEQPAVALKPGDAVVTDAYRDLCAYFLPQVISDVSMAITAKEALKAAKDYRPRGQRGAAVELYILLVERLLKDFFTGVFAEFEREGDYADKDVLQVLIASSSISLADAAMKSGLSETYLELVLAGNRPLSRLAISALSQVYGTSPAIFSRGPNLGMLRGPFKVTSHFNCYTITDTRSSRSHEIGDGVDSVKLDPDDPSDEMSVPDCFGFIEAWERDFNSNIYQTMEAYFDTNKEEEDPDEEDDPDEADTVTAEETFEPTQVTAVLDEARSASIIPVEPMQPQAEQPERFEHVVEIELPLNTSAADIAAAQYDAAVAEISRSLTTGPNRKSAEVHAHSEVNDRQIAILLYSLRRLQNDLHVSGSVHQAEYEGLEQPITAVEIDELCQLINLGK